MAELLRRSDSDACGAHLRQIGMTNDAGDVGVVYKQYETNIEPLDERHVRFTISTSTPDRAHDVVETGGIDTTAFETNPVVMWAHDYAQLPIGRCVSIERLQNKLVGIVEFVAADLNPFAEQVFRLVKAGFLRACSIGFRPLEWEYDDERGGVTFQKSELLEWSICPIPANAEALVAARASGIDTFILKEWAHRVLAMADTALRTNEASEADPIHPWDKQALLARVGQLAKGMSPRDVSTEMADEGEAWDAPTLADFTSDAWTDLDAAEKRRIAGHFAWASEMPPETFGSLKLPHHRASDGKVVWRGIVAAIARLNQADLPAGDLAAVKAHFRRHYRAFRPDADLPEAIKAVADEVAAPDEDGMCPDGMVMGEDGMCHLASSSPPPPLFAVGDRVAVADRPGEIVAISDGPAYAIAFDGIQEWHVASELSAVVTDAQRSLLVATARGMECHAPFDRDGIGWRAFVRARSRAALQGEIDERHLADLLEDYGFEPEAATIRAPLQTTSVSSIDDEIVVMLDDEADDDADEAVITLSDDEPDDLVLVDEDMLAGAVRDLLSGIVTRELTAVVNAARGRIDD